MEEFIVKSKSIENGLDPHQFEYYKLDGSAFIHRKALRAPRLKASSENGNGAFGTFDDYDQWFNEDSDEQRFGNNTDEIIWFKPESTITINGVTYCETGSYPIDPGEYTTIPIDGFCSGNTVVKITDYYNSVGVSTDSYDAYYSNPIWGLINNLYGGEIDGEWLEDNPYSGFESLYNRREH